MDNNLDEKLTQPSKSVIARKNSWLYPEDEFGKMEQGVVYDERIYSNHNIPSDGSNTKDYYISNASQTNHNKVSGFLQGLIDLLKSFKGGLEKRKL